MRPSEEIKVGPFFFTFEWGEEHPDYGDLHISGEEETIAYGEFVSRENWDEFKSHVTRPDEETSSGVIA